MMIKVGVGLGRDEICIIVQTVISSPFVIGEEVEQRIVRM